MKKIFNLVTFIFLLAITSNSFAQTVGIKAGLNLSNMVMKVGDETVSDDLEMNPGFHVGVTVDTPINDVLSFDAGVLLSTKGYMLTDEEEIFGETRKAEVSLNFYYVDIPLTLKASHDIGGAKIYGAFGPYVGFGLSGTYKGEVSYAGESDSGSEDIDWGDGTDGPKRLDYGLTFGAGVEINAFQIGVNYGWGLANILADYDTATHRVLGISLGYKFVK